MKNKISLFYLISLLSINIALSKIYPLKKVSTNLKTLHRKRRTSGKEDSFLENVYGDSHTLFYYYATLYLGKKKIPQTYILDTGSHTTTSPCNQCRSCGKHLNLPYEIDNDSDIIQCYTDKCSLVPSSFCSNHKCGFSISYTEGSRLEGFFTMQEIHLEMIDKTPNITTNSFKIPIGCTTKETHLFTTQLADGIMGLNNGDKSFVTLLFNQKIISKNLFTICFGQNDGYFSIGEIDTSFHNSKIEYVPLFPGESNFYVKLNKIRIGEEIILTYYYRGFIDSGTTISYFPKEIYNSLINYFISYCNKIPNKKCGTFKKVPGEGYCGFFNTIEDRKKALEEYWPNITLYFEGHKYTLRGIDYSYEYNENLENKIWACLGFEGETTYKITLGGTFMHNHDIIFDKDNQRIGFASADCNRKNFKGNNNRNENSNSNNKNNIDIIFKENSDKKGGNFNKIFFYLILSVLVIIVITALIIIFIRYKKLFKKNRSQEFHPQVDDTSQSQKKGIYIIETK